jgi:thiazole synthase
MEEAILASGSEMVTVAIKRIDLETETDIISISPSSRFIY